MAGLLKPYAPLGRKDGDKKPIKASALDGATLRAGNPITVWRQQVPSDKVYWFGYGTSNTEASVARKYADLVDASSNDIEGNVSVAITDSDGHVKASREVGDAATLRDAAADARTERPPMEALAPFANPDRYVEVRINADSASDGVTVDPAASSMRLWYTTTA